MKQIILSGLADVKKEVLGMEGINGKCLADTLKIIEDKETAARSFAKKASSSAATTTHKRIAAEDKRLKGTAKCDKCAQLFQNKKVRSRKGQDDTVTTFKTCKACWRKDHPLSQAKDKHKSGDNDEKAATEENAMQSSNPYILRNGLFQNQTPAGPATSGQDDGGVQRDDRRYGV